MRVRKTFTVKSIKLGIGLVFFLTLWVLLSRSSWGQETPGRKTGEVRMKEMVIRGEVQKPQAMFFLHLMSTNKLKPHLEELEATPIAKVLKTLDEKILEIKEEKKGEMNK